MCCSSMKGARNNREDAYKIAADEPSPGDQASTTPTVQKYTWEKRAEIDLSKYKVAQVDGALEKRTDIKGQQFLIENCKNSVILLLDNSATVTVDDCENCLIVIGPCAGSVFIRDTNKCSVWAVCQQLRTRDCHDLKLALHCATQPIIENTRLVVFHPLALNYSGIRENLIAARLSPFLNNAHSVHDFTPDKYTPNYTLSKKMLLPQQPLSLLLSPQQTDVSFQSNSSFFIATPREDGAAGGPTETLTIYVTQSEGETVEAFFTRCLPGLADLRIDGVSCTATRDVLATKNDLIHCMDSCPEFTSGHIVALYLDCEAEKREEVPGKLSADWKCVPESLDDTFRITIDRLNLSSLSV
ncbi:unnamed protein product, partial [Mesorhabditis spiculigera]